MSQIVDLAEILFVMHCLEDALHRRQLFRQFRENGLPSNLYRLHTKISFKPTNIPMWKILLWPRSLLKSKPNLIEHASDAIIASTDAKMFCQSDTVQLSSHLKISFSSFRRDYDNFLMAYFHHWNTWLGNINKKLSLVKSRCKKFRIQDWG